MNQGGEMPQKGRRALAAVAATMIAAVGGAIAVTAIAADAPTVRGGIYNPHCQESYLQTAITKGPGKKTGSSKATFKFEAQSCSNPGTVYDGASFVCALDGSKFKDCDSPRRYSGLDKGKHRFEVKGRISAEVDPSPAKYKWKVKG